MKKIILSGIILGFFSCTSQDSIYEEYLVPNGRSYPVRQRMWWPNPAMNASK